MNFMIIFDYQMIQYLKNNFIYNDFLHKNLKLQMCFFAVVLVFSVLCSSVYFFIEGAPMFLMLLFFCCGASFGSLVGKYKKMEWDGRHQKIMNRFDFISVFLFVVNVIYIFYHKPIISEITHLKNITSISFALVSGVMIGRLYLIISRIKKITSEYLEN